jgi:hypothetical protein
MRDHRSVQCSNLVYHHTVDWNKSQPENIGKKGELISLIRKMEKKMPNMALNWKTESGMEHSCPDPHSDTKPKETLGHKSPASQVADASYRLIKISILWRTIIETG